MEVLQPPSAAGPAPGAQMAPERRGGAQARFEPHRLTRGWDPLRGSMMREELAAKGQARGDTLRKNQRKKTREWRATPR